MNKNGSNPCFPFSLGEGDESAAFNFISTSLSAAIKQLQAIETLEEFLPLSMAMDEQEDCFVLVRAVALNVIDQQRLYLEENCTSIYDFCARQRGNVFTVSRGTVQNNLVFAETLYELSGDTYRDSIHTYLENEGKLEGRGVLSEDGIRLEFRLADFAGHVSKLDILRRLIDKVKIEIDWHEFFTDGFEEYEEYAHPFLYPERKQQEQSANNAIDNFNNPFSPGGIPPKELAEPQANDEKLEVLDPFSAAANGQAATPDEIIQWASTTHHFDRLDFNKVPSGTLAGHPIYDETDLYSDADYADRALTLMRKELA